MSNAASTNSASATSHTSPNASSPRPSVWSLAGPSIAVFMMTTLAQVLIIRLVADLGTEAVAIVTAGQRVNFIVSALLMGMGAATTALVARAWGANDRGMAAAYTRLSMRVGLFATAIIVALSILAAEPLAHFFQLTDNTLTEAATYIRWICLAGISQAIVMILSTACRAVGDAKTPLYLGSFTNVISVVAAYGFAYGKWGLPDMGVQGAAIGWGIAFTFCAMGYLLWWMRDRLTLPFTTSKNTTQPSLKRFIQVSMPATIEQLFMQLAMLTFIGFVAGYGTEAFAAYGVGMNLFSVAMVIALGFSIASSALVGQSLGAGDPEGAIKNANHALKLSMITMIASGLLSAIFATELSTVMVKDPEVIRLTAQFVLALAILQPLLAIDFTLGGAMRGAGDTRFPLIAGFITIFGVRLPLAGIFVWLGLPVGWVYSVFIVDQLVKSIMITRRYRKRTWLGALD